MTSCRLSHCIFRWVYMCVCHCAASECDRVCIHCMWTHNCCLIGGYTSNLYSFISFRKTYFKPYYRIRFSFFLLKLTNIYDSIVLYSQKLLWAKFKVNSVIWRISEVFLSLCKNIKVPTLIQHSRWNFSLPILRIQWW